MFVSLIASGRRRTLLLCLLALLAAVLGKALAVGMFHIQYTSLKLAGKVDVCPWSRLRSAPEEQSRFEHLFNGFNRSSRVLQRDTAAGLELVSAGGRTLWLPQRGSGYDGEKLLDYLLAEHQWMAETSPGHGVRAGDVVLDCGAHVGVFSARALAAGARTVVAVEPDPVNLECLRRNFKTEIRAGRVVIVPKGVWSAEQELTLHESNVNSGMNSVVEAEDGAAVKIAVTTIDKLLNDLGLARIDFIKMDIEGAEREALRGAAGVLRRFRPRLMLDSYHRPDDMTVLPAIIYTASPDYRMYCGPCELNESGRVVPHVTFYE